MVLNMIILGLLQVATIYAATFNQFLAIRALFGLFMGGVYGNAISMALENCPYVYPSRKIEPLLINPVPTLAV
jgi:MFS family permease